MWSTRRVSRRFPRTATVPRRSTFSTTLTCSFDRDPPQRHRHDVLPTTISTADKINRDAWVTTIRRTFHRSSRGFSWRTVDSDLHLGLNRTFEVGDIDQVGTLSKESLEWIKREESQVHHPHGSLSAIQQIQKYEQVRDPAHLEDATNACWILSQHIIQNQQERRMLPLETMRGILTCAQRAASAREKSLQDADPGHHLLYKGEAYNVHAERALQLFEQMKPILWKQAVLRRKLGDKVIHVKETLLIGQIYSILLDLLSKSTRSDFHQESRKILKELLKRLSELPLLKSSGYTSSQHQYAKLGGMLLVAFNSVLHGCAREVAMITASQDENKTEDARLAAQRTQTVFNAIESNCGVSPDIISYGNLLWALSLVSADRADSLLQQMLQRNSKLVPDRICFQLVLDAWEREGAESANAEDSSKTLHAAGKAQDLLERILSSEVLKVDSQCFEPVMKAWSHTRTIEGAVRAQSLFENMQEHMDTGEDSQPRSVSKLVVTVIRAWTNLPDGQGADHGELFLRAVIARYWVEHENQTPVDGSIDYFVPTAFMFHTVMKSWVTAAATMNKKGGREAAQRIEGLFTYMQSSNIPDATTHSLVMAGWAQCHDLSRVETAYDNLLKAYKESEQDPSLKPTSINTSIIIDAWSKSNASDAAQRAEAWLDRAYTEADGDEERIPDQVCFNNVINAYAQIGSAQKAEGILRRMGTNTDLAKPDTISFNSTISAYARSDDTGANQKVDTLLAEMKQRHAQGDPFVRPDLFTYNAVISTLANSIDITERTADRAQALLSEMMEPSMDNLKIKPNINTFASVIHAWARLGNGHRAEELVLQMQKLHLEGTLDIKPNTVIFSTVIDAWSKSDDPHSAKRADAILRRMQLLNDSGNVDVSLDRICYNTTIRAWADKQKNIAGFKLHENMPAMRSEALLKEMLERFINGNEKVDPDIFSFTAVMNGWSRSGHDESVRRNTNLLSLLVELNEKGILSTKPDVTLYNTLLNTIAKSKEPNKATSAHEVLSRMEDSGVQANTRSYNAVITACSSSFREGKQIKSKALGIASNLLKKMRTNERIRPNDFTYNSFIKACAKLSNNPVQSTKLIQEAFRMCCEDGQLSESVWNQLHEALPMRSLMNLLESNNFSPPNNRLTSTRDLPPEWSRSVKHSKSMF